MGAAIYKALNGSPIKITGGSGAWLIDDQDRQILDSCGGVAVTSLGYRHPRMREAMIEAADRVAWAHAGSFSCDAVEELASFLTERSGGLRHAQFLSGGSEAVEVALKVAIQYHHERGDFGRTVFIARRQSYHGSTLGTLSISGNRDRRSIFEPFLREAVFVSPCYQYRDQASGETDRDYGVRLAKELDAAIREQGPGKVAAFVAEPVVGSTSGAVPSVTGYFQAVREVCDRHGVLLILDDVMSGMGRTGSLFSHLDEGILPDIVAIGKGLAAGYQPISAYLVAEHIFDAMAKGAGVLRNGQTHVNHPYACAVALSAQRILEEESLLAAAKERGDEMKTLLRKAIADHPYIGDIRGRGALLGVEFVADRTSKRPLHGGSAFAAQFKRAALEHRLLTYPGAGTVDGNTGNHVMFAPPFVSSRDDIAEMVLRFERTVDDVMPLLAEAAECTAPHNAKTAGVQA